MRVAPNFEGWERYPENLDLGGQNGYRYDCNSYHEQLKNDSERLFIPGGNLTLKVIESGREDRLINNTKGLEDYLLESKSPETTRLFLIPQEYSWGSLVISLEGLCKLFTYLAVYPAFIDILRAFGEKTNFEDETYSGFRFQPNTPAGASETSYLIKHVEEHGRKGPSNPWSVRQMGVYHKTNPSADNIFVILNPSKSFLRRLKQAQQGAGLPGPWELHLMILACAMENWRWCISDLERECASMKTKAQLSNIVEEIGKETFAADVHFDDTQDLQVLQDRSVQLRQFLGMNRHVLHEIRHNKIHFRVDSGQRIDESFLLSLIADSDEQIRRTETVLRRLDDTLGLVRSILDIRCLESLRNNSRIMNEMTRLSRTENAMILELTQKASRDTDTLKTLTLLTLIYLPASFVASMMGMGYIHVDIQGKGQRSISVVGEFWVFLVLTIILLIVTLCSYYWWLRGRRTSTFGRVSRSYESI